jgi:hypothetical protein
MLYQLSYLASEGDENHNTAGDPAGPRTPRLSTSAVDLAIMGANWPAPTARSSR